MASSNKPPRLFNRRPGEGIVIPSGKKLSYEGQHATVEAKVMKGVATLVPDYSVDELLSTGQARAGVPGEQAATRPHNILIGRKKQ